MAEENANKRTRTNEEPYVAVSLGTKSNENLHVEEIAMSNRDGFTEDALSNYVVLTNIFTHLDNNSVESCCQLNKCWNSIADPHLVRHYDIRLENQVQEMDPSAAGVVLAKIEPVTMTKKANYNSGRSTYAHISLQHVTELLEAALKTEKIAINLHLWDTFFDRNEQKLSFLSQFGQLVEKCRVNVHGWSVGKFCTHLVRYFPRLKHLDLSQTTFCAGDLDFDESLVNGMKFLEKIDNFRFKLEQVSLVNLFRLAPNLTEIHDFPIFWVDAVVEAGKVGCLKSLKYPENRAIQVIHTALEKLSNLELQLTSFSFKHPKTRPLSLSLSGPVYQPFVRRILQSSYGSLKTLTLYKTESFLFESIPCMLSLKEVVFCLEHKFSETKFFNPDTVLRSLFPNVSAVSIPTDLYDYSDEDIAKHFPENQFAPWGRQIEKLSLAVVSRDSLHQLSRLFPSVKELRYNSGGDITDLQHKISAIGEYWPELEHLTVVLTSQRPTLGYDVDPDGMVENGVVCITYAWNYNEELCGFVDGDGCTLDSAFTGIPENILAQLRDPLFRTMNFSFEQIQRFKEASSIGKLRRLKVLEFDMVCEVVSRKFIESLSALTSVSREFGFQFLPDLKVTVRTHQEDIFREVSDMRTLLEAVMNVEVK